MRLLKQKDQHILMDKVVLRRVVEYAEISDDEVVLEVGSGPGNLTFELLKRAKKVIGIEKDHRMVGMLRRKFSREIQERRFELIQGDALKISFPEFDKFVANIPYSISSPLTFKLLDHKFKLAIVMYQKEFAERLTANAGTKKYGRLSVMAKALCKAEIMEIVSRRAFKPIPKVDSAIVKLIPTKNFDVEDLQLFGELVRKAFSMRRKKFGKAIEEWCEENGVDLAILGKFKDYFDKRPEEIEAEVFASMANEVSRWKSIR
ncbi:MAG: ribosomal RNA small subunit methyltransferase A [Archaeoglobus sp.]|nr:ribosomal RNA small subunit methyltransferase A [Archaeoglobus sp.]